MPSLSVGIPTNGNIRSETFIAYLDAYTYLLRKRIPVYTTTQMGNHIDYNRNKIVLNTYKNDSTHIMMIDTDMVFSDDAIYQLLEQDKDIIGGNYNRRLLPLSKGTTESNVKMFGPNNEPVTITEIPLATFKCHTVPTGFMLIKKAVFDKLTFPWFETYQEGDDYFTEDVDFGIKCHKAGIDMWCDPTIKIGHIGECLY